MSIMNIKRKSRSNRPSQIITQLNSSMKVNVKEKEPIAIGGEPTTKPDWDEDSQESVTLFEN